MRRIFCTECKRVVNTRKPYTNDHRVINIEDGKEVVTLQPRAENRPGLCRRHDPKGRK